jgi:adenylate cyclase
MSLALVLNFRIVLGLSADSRADAERAEMLANEALSAEPDSAHTHYVKALVYMALVLTRRNTPTDPLWEAGIAEADAAVRINRNYAGAHATSAWYRLFLGRAAEGFAGIETAMRLSPRDPARPSWEYQICHLHSHLAQWDQAIEHCRVAAQGMPNFWYPVMDVVLTNAWLGRDAEAKAALAELLKLYPGITCKAVIELGARYSDNPIYNQQIARMVEGLRKAGLPEQ